MVRFSESELKIIEQFLINRIVGIRELEISTDSHPVRMFKSADPFSLVAHVDILDKVKSGVAADFSSKELAIIQSCVHEGLQPILKKVINRGSAGLTPISDEEQSLISIVKGGKSVLKKTGFFTRIESNSGDGDFSILKGTNVRERMRRLFEILFSKPEGSV